MKKYILVLREVESEKKLLVIQSCGWRRRERDTILDQSDDQEELNKKLDELESAEYDDSNDLESLYRSDLEWFDTSN